MDQNGVITGYQVLYQPLDMLGRVISTHTMNKTGLERSLVVENLEEYIRHKISVRAYTSVGEGPYSEAVVERTREKGKSSLVLAFHNAIFVSFVRTTSLSR